MGMRNAKHCHIEEQAVFSDHLDGIIKPGLQNDTLYIKVEDLFWDRKPL